MSDETAIALTADERDMIAQALEMWREYLDDIEQDEAVEMADDLIARVRTH